MLNSKNNIQNVLAGIINKGYILVFSNPKIALSKKFKNSVLDQSSFTDHFCLLAIDRIYFVEECDKNFRIIYAKIEKVQKQTSCHLFLLEVLAMLTKNIYLRVVKKVGFLRN